MYRFLSSRASLSAFIISFVLLGITAVLSFSSFCICGMPGCLFRAIPSCMPICIDPHLCVCQTGLRTKCCALLVQLVKVFANPCWRVFCYHIWFIRRLKKETQEKEKRARQAYVDVGNRKRPLKRQSVNSLCFWHKLSLSDYHLGSARFRLDAPRDHSHANSFKGRCGLSYRPYALNFTLCESGSTVCLCRKSVCLQSSFRSSILFYFIRICLRV